MEKNEIIYGNHKIRVLEDSVLIDSKILIFGDVHLGYEELYARGGNFPMIQLNETKEKLERIFSIIKKGKKRVEKIIIIGDFVHNFGSMSNSEFRGMKNFLNFLEKLVKKENIIFIKGNHDTTSSIIIKRLGFKVADYYKIKDIIFIHGDKSPENKLKDIKLLVMGHLHPTIKLSDKYKNEKYKCFLFGRWKKIKSIILPSFMDINYGYNLNNITNASSLNKQKLSHRWETIINLFFADLRAKYSNYMYIGGCI